MSPPLLQLKHVELVYPNKTVLKNIDLSIQPQHIATIIGPNGAGKSSLVKLITGLIRPSRGKIFRCPNLRIGYVPQKLTLDRSLPIKVGRFLSLADASKESRFRAQEQLSISHLNGIQLHRLSGGELQRVLLARAILRNPQLLVLDEPLQGVDVNGQVELYHLIASLRDSLSCAIVMVSHDLHLVMAQSDVVICLNQHICCQGKPDSVSKHPEYLKMFGNEFNNLAVYTHKHDHRHDLHGDVVACDDHCTHSKDGD